MKKIKHIVSIAVIILLTATAGAADMDKEALMQKLEQSASKGNVADIIELSYIYYYVENNDKKAAEWLSKAAEQRENKDFRCFAQVRQAWVKRNDERDYAGSLRILRQAESEGCPNAKVLSQTWEDMGKACQVIMSDAHVRKIIEARVLEMTSRPVFFLGGIEGAEQVFTKAYGDAKNIQSALVGNAGIQRGYSYATFIVAFHKMHKYLTVDDYRRLLIIASDVWVRVDPAVAARWPAPELWNFPGIGFAKGLEQGLGVGDLLKPALENPKILKDCKIYAKLIGQLFTQDIDGAVATIRTVPDIFVKISGNMCNSDALLYTGVLDYFMHFYRADFMQYLACDNFGCDQEKAKAWVRRNTYLGVDGKTFINTIYTSIWGETTNNGSAFAQFVFFDYYIHKGEFLKSKKGPKGN